MFTKTFWKDALERAVKTFAEAILTIMTLAGIQVLANPLEAFSQIKELGIVIILIAGGIAFIYSILTSIISSFVGDKNSASVIK